MNKTKLNFEFDVRIPDALIQQMMDGEITCSMLVTMTLLYKWANWATGRVRFCSAGGLVTATHKAYSERTFQVCLQKLDEMGWITRHMVRGSRKDYPVTIHNYKVVDDAGKVSVINPSDIRVPDPFKTGACGEGSDEASDEGSDTTNLNHLPELLPDHDGLTDPLTNSLKNLREEQNQNLSGEEARKEQNQTPKPYPTTADEFHNWHEHTPAMAVMEAFYPSALTDSLVAEQYGACCFLAYMPWGLDGTLAMLKWNRIHENGKWRFRSPSAMANALCTHKQSFKNSYDTHDFYGCPKCKGAGVIHYEWQAEAIANREADNRDSALIFQYDQRSVAQKRESPSARTAGGFDVEGA